MEQYIEECLISILSSTRKPDEIIVVDFGSYDSTVDIIKRLANNHSSLSLIHDPEGNAASARNCGLKAATSDFIVFIDCDDWISPNMLQILQDKMLVDNQDIVSCSYYNVYENGRKEEILFPDSCIIVNKDNINDVVSWVALGQMSAELWTKMYRLDFLKSNNIWLECENGIHGEDVCFNYSALLHMPRLTTISEPLYYHRIRENSLTHKKIEPLTNRFTTIVNNLRSLAKQESVWADAGIAQLYISLIIQDVTNFKEKKERLCILNGYLRNNSLSNLFKLAAKNPKASLKRRILCILLAFKQKNIILLFLPK